MPSRRWPGRAAFGKSGAAPAAGRTIVLLIVLLIAAGSITILFIFRGLVTELAVSDAQDAVVITVNGIVKEIMQGEEFASGQLISLEKDSDGSITAVTTNVSAINILEAEILAAVVNQTSETIINVQVPVGNLTGSALLLNRGPKVPVEVILLSSSMGGFRSELTAAGINQTRHQILLDLEVQLSLLMPWRTIDTSVVTEILVSETVIVGKVPDSYLNWEN